MNLRNILFASVLTLFTVCVYAAPIDPARAINVAEQFMPAQHVAVVPGKAQAPAQQQTPEIVYTHFMPKSGKPAIYVINISGGFALVSADNVAHPVLGYNYGKPWPTDVDSLAPSAKGFLDDLAAQMEAASEHPQDAETAAEWQEPRHSPNRAPRRAAADTSLPDSVGPLLTTTWDQGQYYNAMCPEDPYGPDRHVYTGCVATAMAQIIKYWGDKQEIKTRGIHSYDSNYGNLRVNYDSTSYDFAHMPNALTSESSQQEVNAVAKLMYECGVAVNMGYSPQSSGAYPYDVYASLINFFSFSPHIGFSQKSLYSEKEWANLIITSISQLKPIYYSGGFLLGHSFVLDGYKSGDYYHFNFGWSGNADGWYKLSSINPNLDFSSSQKAIMNIFPDTTSQAIVGNNGNNKFKIQNNLDFYNTFGLNRMRVSRANSELDHVLTLFPNEEYKQVVIDVLSYEDEELVIYDGTTTDILLRKISSDNKNNDFSPIVSTQHALTIVNKRKLNPKGFHLRINEDGSCRMVSNISAKIHGTFINLSWVENGASTSWKVEYGRENFITGEGTALVVNTNNINIPIDNPDVTLEFRIQPVCDTIDNKLVNSFIVNKKRYWKDVVTKQPEGYHVDENGTIVISSAEGLGWLAKQYENKNYWETGGNISIEADIDLSQYLWDPIIGWRWGNFYGNGHIISNMNVSDKPTHDEGGNVGLFSSFGGDTISDIGFSNAYVASGSYYEYGDVGVIAGSGGSQTVVINCFSQNHVLFTEWSAGGLFGDFSGTIINCYSYGKIYGDFCLGGFVGDGAPHIFNSYTSSEPVDVEGFGWKGLVCAYTRGGTFINCFADIDYIKDTWSAPYIGTLYDEDSNELGYFFGLPNNIDITRNVAGFTREGVTPAHTVPEVSLSYQYDGSVKLDSALNQFVIENNSPLLRTWTIDGITKLPILGDYYEVTCPNVSNIIASNIPYNEGFAVALSWTENGMAEEWQIKCLPYGVNDDDSALYYTSFLTKDTIKGLQLGKKYDFYVRPICDTSASRAWGAPISYMVDKTYWVDVITSCPEGYIEDDKGNITISTAEGLAWLSVCSNGLNGQASNTYEGKTISIVSNIDMGAYRWLPISQYPYFGNIRFNGVIHANGHVISNLYCNEEELQSGFIGYAENASIFNLSIENSTIMGNKYLGTLFGEASQININNCHIINTRVRGLSGVGGLGGCVQSYGDQSSITNCSSTGLIYGDESVGGLVGRNAPNCVVANCYSGCKILKSGHLQSEGKGGFCGGADGILLNNFSYGDVEWNYNVWGNSIGTSLGILYPDCEVRNLYGVQQDSLLLIANTNWGTHTVSDTATFNQLGRLEPSVTIGETEYTDLLSALNAWVDANNEEGKYRHWVSDTAKVNSGFPIFAALPKYEIIFKDENGTILQRDSVELGCLPYYRGNTPFKQGNVQYGYIFVGWDKEIVAVTCDATYTATFSLRLNKYLITFLNDDESVLCAEEWEYGSMPSCEEPTKEADKKYTYSFAGWQPEIVEVTGVATYTATYDATENTALPTIEQSSHPIKIIENGKIFILRDGKTYTVQGEEVR